MNKLTVEQKIKREHVWLMGSAKYRIYGGIIMIGKVEVDDDTPTACTNGRDVWYGRGYMDTLDHKEIRAVILHENEHKAFRHTIIWKHLYEEDAKLANMACDYVINLHIYDSDPEGKEVRLPEGALLDEKFRGMDAGEVFRMLKKEQKEGGGSGRGEPLDEHDWEGAEDMTPEERDQLEHEIDNALRQGALLAGKTGGDVPREVTEATTPKVDWREALREFVTSFCQEKDVPTWRKPSRRWIAQDIYMPSMIGESVGRMVVGVDMSGSIGAEQIGQFLGELQHICETVKPEGIDLLYWDTRVCQHEKFEQDQLDTLLTTTKPRGGGGTDPQCLVDYIKAHKIKPECAVILTDGYVPGWGKGWDCPVLWGITSKNITAGVGVTVRVQ